MKFAVKFQFFFYQFVGALSFFAVENVVENVVLDLVDVVGDLVIAFVAFDLVDVFAPLKAFFSSLLFGEWVEVLGDCFIVSVRSFGEKLAPFFICDHLFLDFFAEFLVFFFAVLFVEDAVLILAEADTAEAVAGGKAKV